MNKKKFLIEERNSILSDMNLIVSDLTKTKDDIQIRMLNNEFENERTQKEVADILGISQSYISRLEKKIMKRLKREILKISWWKK